ncbi:hypothetical protein [Acetobacterium wieringae]|uniref:hypothetical protein n=1 Tax=Acetobacterium wieringae TaxID=52694 RepID=UPI0026ED649B|nr:hypothetical protein [Acetobacterium wieringae]
MISKMVRENFFRKPLDFFFFFGNGSGKITGFVFDCGFDFCFDFVSDLMVLRGRVSGLRVLLDVFFEPGFRLFSITLFFLLFKLLPRWEIILFADRSKRIGAP